MQYDPSTCCKIIHTCVLLHNLCVQLGLDVDEEEQEIEPDQEVQPDLPGDQSNMIRLGAIRRREIMEELWQKKLFDDAQHQRLGAV